MVSKSVFSSKQHSKNIKSALDEAKEELKTMEDEFIENVVQEGELVENEIDGEDSEGEEAETEALDVDPEEALTSISQLPPPSSFSKLTGRTYISVL